jgi:hypothetical protein
VCVFHLPDVASVVKNAYAESGPGGTPWPLLTPSQRAVKLIDFGCGIFSGYLVSKKRKRREGRLKEVREREKREREEGDTQR